MGRPAPKAKTAAEMRAVFAALSTAELRRDLTDYVGVRDHRKARGEEPGLVPRNIRLIRAELRVRG